MEGNEEIVMRTNDSVYVHQIKTTDERTIQQIANWYQEEWKIPVERTIQRLTTQAKDDILFQFVLKSGDKEIATGGLYHKVGLFLEHPRFKAYTPWVALVYTCPESRQQGFGEKLMKEIERHSLLLGYATIYLFTFTAERLYQRLGWTHMERVMYKGHDAVVMKKTL